MQVTAETQDGYLIQATGSEIKEILTSVNGKRPAKIEIGQKIPAIDYATTIVKIKSLQNDYDFKYLFERIEAFYKMAGDLQDAVNKANDIEI